MSISHRAVATAVAVASVTFVASGAANADPITVYAGYNLSSLIEVATSTTGFLSGSAVGTNIAITYSATGTPILAQPQFDTSSIQVNTTGNANSPFYLAIVEKNLTSPLGVNNFESAFSNTSFTGLVNSVTLTTEISTSNADYGGTVLASTEYTSATAAVADVDSTPSLSNPFSETALYEVTWTGMGSDDSGITISDVPEPSSVLVMGLGLLGLGALARSRRCL